MEYHLNINSDIHCEKDLLGFDKYVDTINTMVRDRDFKTPFCIGIFGKWGSGKTSFMHLLEKQLLKDTEEPLAIPVWFNPWRYEKEEHLIVPFFKTIEQQLHAFADRKDSGAPPTLLDKIKESAQAIALAARAFAYGASLNFFGLAISGKDAIEREAVLKEGLKDDLSRISDTIPAIYYDITNHLEKAVEPDQFRIAVFIDDLDRCLPDKAVELLESIKLFLDIKGYLFVLGVDRDVVKKGISYRYRFFEHKEKEGEELIISPEDYLDKMIQLPLELPKIESGRRRTFIESLLGEAEGFTEHADIIETAVGENPRTLKRFVNLLAFTVRLAETVKDSIINDPKESEENKALLREYFIPLLYMKWAIIVFCFTKVHSDIKGNWRRLIELQEAAGTEEKAPVDSESGERRAIQIDERLRKVLAKDTQFPDNDWLIARFVYLTESTVISEKVKDVSPGFRQTYQPGDTVLIPKGKFLYGEEKIEKNIDYDFHIDVYPVTNKRYKKFIDSTGHDVPHVKEDWAEPYNWDQDSKTFPEGLENHPVVIVSYNDAEAFCKWRKETEGKEFRLPTEEEWEKSARGEDGREYPWGNEFDFNKLNCADYHVRRNLKTLDDWDKYFQRDFMEKNKNRALTTEAGRFPDGASPYGCLDMAGNVWEWTSSDYDKNNKVLRGGSWSNYWYNVRFAYRAGRYPANRSYNIGFRCARTLR